MTQSDGQTERIDALLQDAAIIDLLRVAFQAGHAAASVGTFVVANARLQMLLDHINKGLRHHDIHEPPSDEAGVRSGGTW